MKHFKLQCMSPLLPPLCIAICTTVRKLFDILLEVELLIYSKKCFLISRTKTNPLFTNPSSSSLAQLDPI